uniref:NADH-ubiquinone oxidoreductase chain 5 n=1 Tax=Cyanidium caldarium TaxID=2771 RepID=A0A7H0WB99_CYACA|nr:NADH dehydrogenase subunit 5 [Cyanidium caldarium]QNR39828.1 NADH dehydrogenase subunit 5 [Cyanidium caldarium]
MYLIILFLPFCGSLFSILFGRWVGGFGSSVITCLCLILAIFLSCIAFYEVGILNYPCYIKLTSWIDSGIFHVSWGFLFDSLTVTMIVIVSVISLLVHIYAIEYIRLDPHLPRFISYLSVFTFFILILVTANNFIQIFLGWEGVGFASYLLINFWFTRLSANKAALKAIVINRIGDVGLSLGILVIFLKFHSVDYLTVFNLVPNVFFESFNFFNIKVNFCTIICLLLFIGVIGKSAQIGLHTWLPDAMEGPTPVSALIHAATIVTAGVFLIIRCSPLFEFSDTALFIVAIIGGITAFFSASIGLFQYDLKKIIAYSTCSQLGYIVFSCGLSNYSVGFFHLFNHAFFKALLFLSAGSVIHAFLNEQDIRFIGGLKNLLPFTYAIMIVGSFSLLGFPFITGFYSKDLILESAYNNFNIGSDFIYWLGLITVLLTAFYSFRLLFLVFLNYPNFSTLIFNKVNDCSFYIKTSLTFLAIGSIFLGYLTKEMLVGMGTDFWDISLFFKLNHIDFVENEYLYFLIKLIPIFFSFFGILFCYLFNYFINLKFLEVQLRFRYFLFFLNKKWGWDYIYTYIAYQFMNFGYYISFKLIDKGILEFFGPQSLMKLITNMLNKLKFIQTGQITHYVFIIILGALVLFTLVELLDVLVYFFNIKILGFFFLGSLFLI